MGVIPKIYQRTAEDLGLFFWVKGQMRIVPTITLAQAIDSYFKFNEIDPGLWDINSARLTYMRMQKEFYEDCKS